MSQSHLREKINLIIFGTSTPAGRFFDVVLIVAIVVSVMVLLLESIYEVESLYATELLIAEWFFTALFTLEYLVRIYAAPKRWIYIRSFYGLVDLLSILPSYIGLLFVGTNYLLVIRLLRVLRVFRVLKLNYYLSEANVLLRSVTMAQRKILVFFMSVFVLATVFGAMMFMVEGPQNGFSSIPKSIYWTIVTITTVGYGDIVPHTVLGQIIAAAVMLTGFSIIAVPTGILTAELAREMQAERSRIRCVECQRAGHESDAKYCRFCGGKLP